MICINKRNKKHEEEEKKTGLLFLREKKLFSPRRKKTKKDNTLNTISIPFPIPLSPTFFDLFFFYSFILLSSN